MNSLLNIEEHPLEPFLPANAVLLMLGSFPPQKKRWSMDFFYPNLQNDMWRIVGLIFFQDKEIYRCNSLLCKKQNPFLPILCNPLPLFHRPLHHLDLIRRKS